MKVFWIFFYNLFLYPLFFTGACIGALFNKKLRKGIMGRWHTHSQLLLFKEKITKKIVAASLLLILAICILAS